MWLLPAIGKAGTPAVIHARANARANTAQAFQPVDAADDHGRPMHAAELAEARSKIGDCRRRCT